MPIDKVTIREGGIQRVSIKEGGVKIVVRDPSIKIVTVGVQGPPGPQGPLGLNDFEQIFSAPLLSWIVNHNLGRRPVVSILTTGSVEIIGAIIHANLNQLTVSFDVPTAGIVRCI